MQVIFILNSRDSIVFIRTLYEIGRWFKENKGYEVIFYLPDLKSLNLLPYNSVEIRWLKKEFQPAEIPEADIIISTGLEMLIQLSELTRGELIYVQKDAKEISSLPERIRIINLDKLKPGIPTRFFHPIEKKRDKIIVAGEGLNKKNVQELFNVFEKAISSIFPAQIIILDAPTNLEINTYLDYQFLNTEKISLIELFETSFYLVWLEEDAFPLLPLWAMAAGVVVINIILSGEERSFPLEFIGLNPLDLALTMIKVYKLGQFRTNIQLCSRQLVMNYDLERAGRVWHSFLEGILEFPLEKKDSFIKSLVETKGETKVVDLVIVNYNTLAYLKKCIDSIRQYTDLPYQLIVVDNGSTDGSKEYLQNFSDLQLIINEDNFGYAKACNQGILAGKGEFIVLLNSDIEVTEAWIDPLIETAKAKDVAVVGPKLINKDGEIVGAGVTQLDDKLSPRGWKVKDDPAVFALREDVLSVSGACYLIKRNLLPILGLFDERYFFYYEESDYSFKAREKGYRVVYCPEAKIYHHHEGSLNPKDYLGRKKRTMYFTNSRKKFIQKWGDIIAGGEKRREPEKIIIGGLIPWDFRLQRPQHLVRNLIQLGYEVLYLNPVCAYKSPQEVEKNIYVYSPPGYGTVLYNLKGRNEIALGRGINQEIKNLGFENGIMILNAPYWTPLLKYWEYSLLVYDCIDNYTEFEDLSRDEEWIRLKEKQLLNLSDLVLTSSQGLYEEKKKDNIHTYLLHNGVDLKHFYYQYQAQFKPKDLPDGSQIIGYFGAIASWFDTKLVADLAKELANVEIVLIGEVSTDISELNSLSNIKLLGEKPYKILPDYLAYFDLAIIPFKENPLTIMTDPVKLYEYLAAGKGVLTTNLSEVKRFKNVVEIAKNKKEFINKAKDMLTINEDNIIKEERFNSVKEETWRIRTLRLRKLLHLAYYDLFLTETINLEEQELLKEVKDKSVKKKDNWLNKLKNWLSG